MLGKIVKPRALGKDKMLKLAKTYKKLMIEAGLESNETGIEVSTEVVLQEAWDESAGGAKLPDDLFITMSRDLEGKVSKVEVVEVDGPSTVFNALELEVETSGKSGETEEMVPVKIQTGKGGVATFMIPKSCVV